MNVELGRRRSYLREIFIRNVAGGAGNHGKPQSGETVSAPRFKPNNNKRYRFSSPFGCSIFNLLPFLCYFIYLYLREY
jgi:hypothetical protein